MRFTPVLSGPRAGVESPRLSVNAQGRPASAIVPLGWQRPSWCANNTIKIYRFRVATGIGLEALRHGKKQAAFSWKMKNRFRAKVLGKAFGWVLAQFY
jgi:hypothetical protein